MYTNPTVTDFKNYFVRDFVYGTTLETVQNADISSAQSDAGIMINPILFPDQATYTLGFQLLSAHFLVLNLRASSQGLSGQYPWLTSGKAVGSVSESFSIPDRIMENPELAMLSKTYYGAKYLFMILPQLTGVMFSVCGITHA